MQRKNTGTSSPVAAALLRNNMTVTANAYNINCE